ncbi:hypothetical protein ACFL3V_03505 [Nanoarchaeota archaeon]
MSNSLDRAAAFYIQSFVLPYKEITLTRQKIIPDSNIRAIRAGALPFKVFNGVRKYLLGHKERIGGKPPAYYHKSPGGELWIGKDQQPLDLSAIDGLRRELKEEDFKGLYGPRNDSIVPVAVQYSSEKGSFQFYSVQLKQYPSMGTRRDAYFAREDGYETKIRWLTIDNVLKFQSDKGHDETIPYETAKAIAATYVYTKSKQIVFNGRDAVPVNPAGNIAIPDSIAEGIVEKTGLSWFPEGAFSECTVYYNFPKRSNIDPALHRLLPSLQVFFMLGPFLHQEALWEDDITELMERSRPDIRHRTIEKVLAKRYVEDNFEEVFEDYGLLENYLLGA